MKLLPEIEQLIRTNEFFDEFYGDAWTRFELIVLATRYEDVLDVALPVLGSPRQSIDSMMAAFDEDDADDAALAVEFVVGDDND